MNVPRGRDEALRAVQSYNGDDKSEFYSALTARGMPLPWSVMVTTITFSSADTLSSDDDAASR